MQGVRGGAAGPSLPRSGRHAADPLSAGRRRSSAANDSSWVPVVLLACCLSLPLAQGRARGSASAAATWTARGGTWRRKATATASWSAGRSNQRAVICTGVVSYPMSGQASSCSATEASACSPRNVTSRRRLGRLGRAGATAAPAERAAVPRSGRALPSAWSLTTWRASTTRVRCPPVPLTESAPCRAAGMQPIRKLLILSEGERLPGVCG